ncbi:MAG: hydroxysqualene dehydroxylase HpnE, partial [Zoogloeaceae bacterium]|nr:hydroxysqualene dehydroxylase HpnE [Zoogloeaceae bacterium]
MKIAIVGGGWAGLAAAIELVDAGQEVTLFEAGPSLGGRARRVESVPGKEDALPGVPPLDNGQHILLGAYRDTLALMEKIGLVPEEMFLRLPLTVLDNTGFCLKLPGNALPAALKMAWGLLTAKGASFAEKWRHALWMRHLKRQRFQLAEDRSVAQWLREGGQEGAFVRHLWEPLCLAALNTPAADASARLFARILQDSLGSPLQGATDLLLPATDLSALFPDPAARWLAARGATLRLACRIKALFPRAEGWQVENEVFDCLILAVAPQHLPELLASLPEAGFPAPPRDFSPIASLYFRYPAAAGLPFPMMALNGGIGQWLIDRGGGLIAAVLSGRGEWENLSRPELARALHAEIRPLVRHATVEPPAHRILIEKRATFRALPGLLRCPQQTPWKGLFLAGDHVWADYPATLEGAVRSGQHAAWLCLG